MIRVLLADDHKIVREGLSALLGRKGRIEVVANVADGKEALAKALALDPDIAILDVTMPGLNGIEVTHQLHLERPEIGVIILSMHADRQFVTDAEMKPVLTSFPWSYKVESTSKIRGGGPMRRVSVLSVLVAAGCLIQMPCLSSAAENESQASSHLRMWDTSMGMTLLDHKGYPATEDIRELAMFMKDQGYWEEPIVRDPWGSLYQCRSSQGQFNIWTVGPDGIPGTSDDQSVEAKADIPSPVEENPSSAGTEGYSRSSHPKVGDNLTATRTTGTGGSIRSAWR